MEDKSELDILIEKYINKETKPYIISNQNGIVNTTTQKYFIKE